MKEFIVTMANIIEYGTFFFPHRHETLEKWQYFCGCVEQMLEDERQAAAIFAA